MDIYIKPMEKVQIIGRRIIYLSDVAEVYAGSACQGKLEKLPVFQIPENTENPFCICGFVLWCSNDHHVLSFGYTAAFDFSKLLYHGLW